MSLHVKTKLSIATYSKQVMEARRFHPLECTERFLLFSMGFLLFQQRFSCVYPGRAVCLFFLWKRLQQLCGRCVCESARSETHWTRCCVKVRPILCHSGYGGSYAGSWVLCQCPGRTDTSKAEIEILILVEKDLGMLT